MEANCLFCTRLSVEKGHLGPYTDKVHVGKCSEKGLLMVKYRRGCAYFQKVEDYLAHIDRVKKLGDRIMYVYQLMLEQAPDLYKEIEKNG